MPSVRSAIERSTSTRVTSRGKRFWIADSQDAELLFLDLLDEVYEMPARREARRRRVLEARHGRGSPT
jgi:hypothetical protein